MSLITLGLATDYLTEAGLSATAPITSATRPFFWQQMERTRANFADVLDNLAAIKHARVTLTDAQVKALPTTPVTIISAPGANLRLDVMLATVRAKTSSGAYTNINATYSALALYWLGDFTQWATLGSVNDSTASPTLDKLSQMLGVTGVTSTRMSPYVDNFTNGWVIPSPLGSGTTDNKALAVAVDNNGSGAFTGGNAANSLQVDVFYTISTAP